MLIPAPHYVIPTTMIDVINHLGLQSNLQMVLDAGDAACYPGSGQSLTDRAGSGATVFLGTSAGNTTDDPAFVGVAGRQSAGEYFRFNPFTERIVTSPTPAWVQTLHKDNAAFTWAGWRRITHDAVNGETLFQTVTSGTPGIDIGGGFGGVDFYLRQFRTSSDFTLFDTDMAIPSGWAFYALSLNEATGAWNARINGSTASGTWAYVSPSSADTAVGPIFGSSGDGDHDMHADAVWTRALSAAELTTLYNATKTKFGL